jgi:hypothetical protein
MSNDDHDQDEPAYDVGYGKPPAHSRFKKGQSGNPKGKKKGSKTFSGIVSRALHEKVPVRTARGTKKITKLEALVHTTINSALKGDAKAVDQILKIAREAGLTNEVADALGSWTMKELADEDQAILDRFRGGDDDVDPDKSE